MGSVCANCFNATGSASSGKHLKPLLEEEMYSRPLITPDAPYDTKVRRVGSAPLRSLREVKCKKIDLRFFEIQKEIGEGAYGKVYKVVYKKTKKVYAMKKLSKKRIMERNELANILTERAILMKAEHPFVVKLHYSFQNRKYAFLVMDYIEGGALYSQLSKHGKFKIDAVKFYAAETLLGLEYLHDVLNVIYRDLKPENLLLDWDGHIRLSDFGLSKMSNISFSFCGTPEYLAPEMITKKGHGKPVDLWCFGCLLYELLEGRPLFVEPDGNRNRLYQRILNEPIKLPEHMHPDSKDLIQRLLQRNPEDRIGFLSLEEIKKHRFFMSINWEVAMKRRLQPPFVPEKRYDLYDLLETAPIFAKEDFSAVDESSIIKQDIPEFTYDPSFQRLKNTRSQQQH